MRLLEADRFEFDHWGAWPVQRPGLINGRQFSRISDGS